MRHVAHIVRTELCAAPENVHQLAFADNVRLKGLHPQRRILGSIEPSLLLVRFGRVGLGRGIPARTLACSGGITVSVRDLFEKNVRIHGSIALNRGGKMRSCIHKICKRKFGARKWALILDLRCGKVARALDSEPPAGD